MNHEQNRLFNLDRTGNRLVGCFNRSFIDTANYKALMSTVAADRLAGNLTVTTFKKILTIGRTVELCRVPWPPRNKNVDLRFEFAQH